MHSVFLHRNAQAFTHILYTQQLLCTEAFTRGSSYTDHHVMMQKGGAGAQKIRISPHAWTSDTHSPRTGSRFHGPGLAAPATNLRKGKRKPASHLPLFFFPRFFSPTDFSTYTFHPPTFSPQTFQPCTLTHRLFTHKLFTHKLFSHRLFTNRLTPFSPTDFSPIHF